MTIHGAGATGFPDSLNPGGGCPVTGGAATARLASSASTEIVGFSHFLRDPDLSERFRLAGADPRSDLDKLRSVMGQLAAAMSRGAPDPATAENRKIPSGYTYVLQFMAHDLVLTSLPFWALDERSPAMRNERVGRLCLDALYGGGPNVCPFVFAPDDRSDTTRTKLRVGPIGVDPHAAVPPQPARRDIVRLGVASDITVDAGQGRLSEALVADPRNDDHSIISQLTTLLHLFHNTVVDELLKQPPGSTAIPLTDAQRRFACARDAVTLVYREIIRNDVMPRTLHDSVNALLKSKGTAAFLKALGMGLPGVAGGLPLEFSHGAFRFGHALVRPTYRISEQTFSLAQVLDQNSHKLPESMPLIPRWIVNWSNFFEINGAAKNYSFKLVPFYNSGLMADRVLGAVDASERAGLAYRDLLSAALSGLWSVDGLVAALRQELETLITATPLLADRAQRVTLIKNWLIKQDVTADVADIVANDPPLPFFILFEAANDTVSQGETLGVLGSIICAAVIYDALDGNPLATELTGNTLGERLKALTQGLYGNECLSGLAELNTMPALVKYVAPSQTMPPAFV